MISCSYIQFCVIILYHFKRVSSPWNCVNFKPYKNLDPSLVLWLWTSNVSPQFSYLEGRNHHICWRTLQSSCEEVRWCRWKDFIISYKKPCTCESAASSSNKWIFHFPQEVMLSFQWLYFTYGVILTCRLGHDDPFGELHIDDKRP